MCREGWSGLTCSTEAVCDGPGYKDGPGTCECEAHLVGQPEWRADSQSWTGACLQRCTQISGCDDSVLYPPGQCPMECSTCTQAEYTCSNGACRPVAIATPPAGGPPAPPTPPDGAPPGPPTQNPVTPDSSAKDESDDNLALIIGASVGGGVVFIAVLILLWMKCFQKQSKTGGGRQRSSRTLMGVRDASTREGRRRISLSPAMIRLRSRISSLVAPSNRSLRPSSRSSARGRSSSRSRQFSSRFRRSSSRFSRSYCRSAGRSRRSRKNRSEFLERDGYGKNISERIIIQTV